jgi:hypothetical protein
MKPNSYYLDRKGIRHDLRNLDADERALLGRVRAYARQHEDWIAYQNYWTSAVAKFYEGRGLSREEVVEQAVYKVAMDIGSRMMIAQGLARAGDYRDELEELIRERFASRREFCKASGLSEDMLSHVLAGRKHLAIDTLTKALARVGYTLRLAPLPDVDSAS